MSKNYLLIENRGVAPVESFTLMGASTARDCNVAGVIGAFGSGSKHACTLLLRLGLDLVIYCGKTRLTFGTTPHVINDGLTETTVNKVHVQFGGTSRKKLDLGWTLENGAIDWTDVGMALRELISNCIDRTTRENAAGNDGLLNIASSTNVRARDGWTRVFVEMTPEVQEYYGNLPKKFLQFSGRPEDMESTVLPKANRNSNGLKTAVIYREGVLVMEMPASSGDSGFDYNFTAKQFSIDECRNSSEYTVRATCAKAIRDLDSARLSKVMEFVSENHNSFEASLDQFWLSNDTTNKDAWKDATEKAFGPTSVVTDTSEHKFKHVRGKGHKAVIMPDSWSNACKSQDVPHADKVLDASAVAGRDVLRATPAAIEAVNQAWELLTSIRKTLGHEKPNVQCFTEVSMSAEASTMGYYDQGTVYIREDIADANSKYLFKVAPEEVAHAVTGATDNSRDLQNYLIEVIAELAA